MLRSRIASRRFKYLNHPNEALVMSQAIHLEVEVPDDLAAFHLPAGVQRRLTYLLDRQDQGQALSAEERSEAEGLVDLADLLALLKLRAERCNGQS